MLLKTKIKFILSLKKKHPWSYPQLPHWFWFCTFKNVLHPTPLALHPGSFSSLLDPYLYHVFSIMPLCCLSSFVWKIYIFVLGFCFNPSFHISIPNYSGTSQISKTWVSHPNAMNHRALLFSLLSDIPLLLDSQPYFSP